jgi:AraC-like DNA-binding protein
MIHTRRVRYQPPSSYSLDLEVIHTKELRRRASVVDLSTIHRVDFHVLICITQGNPTHTVDFAPILCQQGSLLIIRPAQIHTFDITKKWEGWLVLFKPEFLFPANFTRLVESWFLYDDFEQLPTHLQLDQNDYSTILAHIVQMHRDSLVQVKTKELTLLLRYQLYSLLLRIQLGYHRQERLSYVPAVYLERFSDFKRLLEKNFSRHHQVANYANQLGCSERSLTRATRLMVGMSAKEYIDTRINLEAKRLLKQTTLSVSSIAYQIGFDEPTNFIKFFKRLEGCSPTYFRNSPS